MLFGGCHRSWGGCLLSLPPPHQGKGCPVKQRRINLVYHEQPPKYGLGYRLLVILFPLGFIIGGFWLYTHPEVEDTMTGAITLWGVTIFWVLLFRAILPQQYQILDDRVKVILGGPFSFNIPLNSINEVEYPTGFSSQSYSIHKYLACFNSRYYI